MKKILTNINSHKELIKQLSIMLHDSILYTAPQLLDGGHSIVLYLNRPLYEEMEKKALLGFIPVWKCSTIATRMTIGPFVKLQERLKNKRLISNEPNLLLNIVLSEHCSLEIEFEDKLLSIELSDSTQILMEDNASRIIKDNIVSFFHPVVNLRFVKEFLKSVDE
jgi:hypothetical protein